MEMRKLLTDHCMHRLVQRKIDVKQVHETVDNPDTAEDISTRGVTKTRFIKRFDGNIEITVICEVRPSEYRVLTVWKKEVNNDTNKL